MRDGLAATSRFKPGPLIAASSCLLGERVRHDGGHKRDVYITRTIGRHVELLSVCPEFAAGLGVPRPPIRLVESEEGVSARGVHDLALDVTAALTGLAHTIAAQRRDIDGYIFKSKSPSCGLKGIDIYNLSGAPVRLGAGLYAASLITDRPELPVVEEGGLVDRATRDSFIERVFMHYRWRSTVLGDLTPRALIEFNASHKFNVLAHDETCYRRLGRLTARAGVEPIADLARTYILEFMRGLMRPATPQRHVNVLMHLFGILSENLDNARKENVLEQIEQYRLGRKPLNAPLMLVNRLLQQYPHPYLQNQYYLNPHPADFALRISP